MRISPCRYEGAAYLDNMVICGHSYRTHFRSLKELSAGDAVSFTDTDGNKFNYQVTGIEILNADAVEEMLSGDWDLTLFTCTTGGVSRVALRCSKSAEWATLGDVLTRTEKCANGTIV